MSTFQPSSRVVVLGGVRLRATTEKLCPLKDVNDVNRAMMSIAGVDPN